LKKNKMDLGYWIIVMFAGLTTLVNFKFAWISFKTDSSNLFFITWTLVIIMNLVCLMAYLIYIKLIDIERRIK